MSADAEKYYKRAANRIIGVTKIPFPLNDTLMELVQLLVTADEAAFLSIFKKPSLNIDQIKDKRKKMSEDEIRQMLDTLMEKGVIIGSTSSKGVEVFTLMPIFPGLFEFQLMRGESGEKQKKFVDLFEKLLDQLSKSTQQNYDAIVDQIRRIDAKPARVVPIEEKVEIPVEKNIEIGESTEPKDIVLMPQQVSRIIDGEELIAVTHCYCRHEKDLMGDPCKKTDERENCLVFGKVAKHSIAHGFAREITKEQAKLILKESEESGLVHKVFHTSMNLSKNIEGLCSCCDCCCGIFQLYYRGAMPLNTHTFYLSRVDEDECIGCESCIDTCPMQAIEMDDEIARIIEEKCIGCGVCVHACPQEAINLERVGPRSVFVPPVKIKE